MAKPVLTISAAPSFTAISEGSGPPSGAVGTLVSQLIDSGGVLDNYSDSDGDCYDKGYDDCRIERERVFALEGPVSYGDGKFPVYS